MAVILLPDAQADLLALQEYVLDKWSEAVWDYAENEIFVKLAAVDAGFFQGVPVRELVSVGIVDYLSVNTSHHRLVFRKIAGDTYVYLVAGHRQDFQALLMRRLLCR